MKAHRRQFLFGCKEYVFSEGVKTLSLPSGCCLSYEQDLPLATSKSIDTIIIGHVICSVTGKSAKDLVDSVSDVDMDTRHWVGRWILYHRGFLFSDVTTSLALFYPQNSTEFWISSSAALLSEVVPGLTAPDMVFKESNHLAPTTCVKNVKQVMIGEKVDLSTGKILWQGFSPLQQSIKGPDILNTLEKRFKCIADALLRDHFDVFTALTSGQDSRLDFAALLSAGRNSKFSTFTFVKNFLFMNPGDRDLPKAISKKFDVSHLAIKRGSVVGLMDRIYRKHCWTVRSLEPGSPYFYLRNGFWQQVPFRAINIDHCYEIGRNTLYNKGIAGKSEHFSLEDLRQDGYVIDDNDYLRLDEGLKKLMTEFPIDRRDALYLYKSYPLFGKLFQVQDLWVDSLFLGNSREMFSLLLSVSVGDRGNGKFHREVVKRLSPQLAEYPYNPSQPIWQKIFTKVISWLRRN
ncbi:hypothetical protein [Bdellovibrio bacteriovorus]|uniref:hypothetical protein n=1 Tax=Bdellovibrio bacteriovorus TaxID=959 RepID=UPI003D018607